MEASDVQPVIRRMDRQAVPLVAALERESFSVPWSEASFLGELENPRAVYRTAWLDGELAGYAGMHHIVDEGYITNIAVAPRFRRRGIGSALLHALTEYAGEEKLGMLTLEVRASNVPAIALYEGEGFVRCGLRRAYYTHPREDALIMTKALPLVLC